MKLIFKCPICDKKANTEKESKLGKFTFLHLSCGHMVAEEKVKVKNEIDFNLEDGRTLYPFQQEGVKFIQESGFRCLIADEMGLGKTVQVVSAFQNFKDEILPAIVVVKASLKVQWMKELFLGAGLVSQILESKTEPIIHNGIKVYITTYDSLRTATWKDKINYKTIVLDECQQIKNHNSKRTQMVRDLISRKGTTQVKDKYIKGDELDAKMKKVTIISHDLMKWNGVYDRFSFHIVSNEKPEILGKTICKPNEHGQIVGRIVLNKRHVAKDDEKSIIETILHEIAHAITPGAGHKPIWSETARILGADEGAKQFAYCTGSIEERVITEEPVVKYIIATSGTPIKNNASEYFPILNILKPSAFYEQSAFIRTWTDAYFTRYGYKVGGLQNPAKFKEFTKDFIIRRERKEVLPDLPAIRRGFRYTEMNEEVARRYQAEVKQLTKYLENSENDSDFNQSTNILAYMNKMRHLTGYAKIADVMAYVEEFRENEGTEEKLTIFHHHVDVADLLESELKNMGAKVLRLKSTMDASERYDIQVKFKNEDYQILIAPTLACGEGINLQFCEHAIIMEREWNPANEEQAEGRFSRIKDNGIYASFIDVAYPVAIGSIDELFAEYVEKKRQYVKETLGGSKVGEADTWNQSQIIKDIAAKLIAQERGKWIEKLGAMR